MRLNSLDLQPNERKRRKREFFIIIAVIITVSILTFVETRVANFGADFPISNTILMFILININLMLLLLLIFLVLRNLVKLYYDRKRKVIGSKLRTKLLVAFISLTLLPAGVLFFFSLRFITNSIEFWFNVPVEQALENSLVVGREFYSHIESNNKFFLERVAYQINTRKLTDKKNKTKLTKYIQIVQRSFNFNAVEVYSKTSERMTFALDPKLENFNINIFSSDNLRREKGDEQVITITENTKIGELVRTVSTVPFGVSATEAEAFVVISIILPPDLSRNMFSISRGIEEYRQIKILKDPIQISYYIALSIVALLVLFCSVWFAFYLAKTITIPIKKLAEGTRRVAEGELDFIIHQVPGDEMGTLVESFNRMTKDLSVGQKKLSLTATILKQQNTEIREKQQYIEIVLNNVSAGVISINTDGHITTFNKSAEKMLKTDAETMLDKNYKQFLNDKILNMTDEIKAKLYDSRDGVEAPLSVTIEGRPKSFLVHFNELKDDFNNYMGLVVVFDDMTELEKAQRMLAWREVARRVAHEVKNPLTPIALSAQRLKRRYSEIINDQVFDDCTQMIIDHVDLIRNLVNEFATFARFPKAHLKYHEIPLIISETVALYREGHRYIQFLTEIEEDIPKIKTDRQQIKQALINLIDNAIAAVKDKGTITVSLTFDKKLKSVILCVTDDGAGISDFGKSKLFEPYFSTKNAGMGLGLAIVSSIISDHKGKIRVEDNKPSGARFIIEFPAENSHLENN